MTKNKKTLHITPPAHIPAGKMTDVEVTATVKGKKYFWKRDVSDLLDTDEVVRGQVGGFVTFLREHAIVGLAIGFVVGLQAQSVVKQLVESFIEPALQLFFGTRLNDRTFTLHFAGNHANFGWGAMLYALLDLFFVLASVYALVKILKLDKLDQPKK